MSKVFGNQAGHGFGPIAQDCMAATGPAVIFLLRSPSERNEVSTGNAKHRGLSLLLLLAGTFLRGYYCGRHSVISPPYL